MSEQTTIEIRTEQLSRIRIRDKYYHRGIDNITRIGITPQRESAIVEIVIHAYPDGRINLRLWSFIGDKPLEIPIVLKDMNVNPALATMDGYKNVRNE